MLIGGMANMVWGRARLTYDLDLSLLCKDENIPGFIEKLKRKFKLLPADPASFLKQTGVLPAMDDNGIRIDFRGRSRGRARTSPSGGWRPLKASNFLARLAMINLSNSPSPGW